jgi:hypothetical protein
MVTSTSPIKTRVGNPISERAASECILELPDHGEIFYTVSRFRPTLHQVHPPSRHSFARAFNERVVHQIDHLLRGC